MQVFNEYGSMTNPDATKAAREIGHIVKELYAKLIAEGMSIVEGLALQHYLASEVDIEVVFALLGVQVKKQKADRQLQVPVEIGLINGNFPLCYEETCPHKRECANHLTAGDFRTDDGATPQLKKVNDIWVCTQTPKHEDAGAILADGSCVNDRR